MAEWTPRWVAALAVAAMAVPSPVQAQRWLPFDASDLEPCDGAVEIAASGEVTIPGPVRGVDREECPGRVPRVGSATVCDGDGACTTAPLPLAQEPAESHCREIWVELPASARLCEIRFYESDAKGRDYEERRRWRNRVERVKESWRRRGTVWTRTLGERRIFRIEYTNYSRARALRFGYEVRFQLP